jgi:hypothetical protein
LIADIEKLIKKKVEFAPLEREEERPRRGDHFNSGRRAWGDDENFDARRDATPAARDGGRDMPRDTPRYAPRPAPRNVDPFFNKPYEESAVAAPASWESTTKAAPSRVSSNIKSKKKVAALFKTGEPAAQAGEPATQIDGPATQIDGPAAC